MRIAVIGGGVAGCAAAFALNRAGHDVCLYERSSSLGGRALTWRDGGRIVDSGAGFFTSFYPTLFDVLHAVGMSADVIELDRRTVFVKHGIAAPLALGSLRSFAAYRWLSWRDKLRVAAHTLAVTARYRRLDVADPRTLVAIDDRSIAADARRRLGDGGYHHLVRPGVESFWYFSCDDASRALYLALYARAADARFFTLRNGMDSLCLRLMAGVEHRTGADVTALSQSGRGVTVHGVDADAPFDAVVVATPAGEAAKLCRAVSQVPERQRAALARIRYVANVHACFRVASATGLGAATAAFPVGPGSHDIAAISCNRGKRQGVTGGDELVSVYLSGDASERALAAPEETAFARAWQLARAFWPALPREAEPYRLAARREAIPIPAVGSYRDAAAFAAEQTPPVVFAGDYLATATVEGALRTGLRAAATLSPGCDAGFASRLAVSDLGWAAARRAGGIVRYFHDLAPSPRR
jgi:oxygen-dependent protoporphyrinogen oxidase